MDKKGNWFKIKKYSHIGQPLSYSQKHDVESYIRNKDKVAQHAFFPLIRRVMKKYRYVSKGDTQHKVKRAKCRFISYATHLDSAIYSFYAQQISNYYEQFLVQNNLADNIIVYRTLSCKDRKGNKCNIDYAKEVFCFINEKLVFEDVAVIVFDIKGFFDNLDHKLLKYSWKKICQLDSMDAASYAIYKNIIKYSYVEENKLFDLFKDKIICQTPTGIRSKKIKKKKYLRDKKAIAFCERVDIGIIREANLIRKGNFDYENQRYTHRGIPQGLPISAVLANIYMNYFDKNISEDIATFGGLYRRYSDDIIIVCPIKYGVFWKNYIIDQIQSVKLTIEERKTNLFNFRKLENGLNICEHENLGTNKQLEYLGFSYDGNRILIKNSGLGAYYYKMQRNTERCIYFSIHNHNKKNRGKLFENKLVYRFTKLGSRKHRIFVRSKSKPYYFYDSKRRSLGNYWSYVNKSAKIMNSPNILSQLRRNKAKLKLKILAARSILPDVICRRERDTLIKYGRLF